MEGRLNARDRSLWGIHAAVAGIDTLDSNLIHSLEVAISMQHQMVRLKFRTRFLDRAVI